MKDLVKIGRPVRVQSTGPAYLRELAGLSAREVAEKMRKDLNETYRSEGSVFQMERRGSQNWRLITAYAAAIGADYETVRIAFYTQFKKKTT